MELKLKSISRAGVAEAISKAELYRNLNEPGEAESICRDILAVEPDHRLASRLLALAITDQFTGEAGDRYTEAESIFQSLKDPYERLCRRRTQRFQRRIASSLPAGRILSACSKQLIASSKSTTRV